MANLKKCSKCKELKPTTQFSKSKTVKGGLQGYCTACKKTTHDEYMKSGKSGIIYRIVNPLGETYIGATKRKPNVRYNAHKSVYIFQHQSGYSTFPNLHKSFTLWGIDAHTFEVVTEFTDISKKELRDIESNMIIALKKNGKSLNVNN
jgi:hypothetical protein